ncbi:MAG: carbon-nitrogen hydrolase family protein [Lachnospiraceae bacterium]|nr:carbon-nitrogen hydrolase family protein [Lachnospiraceae bacterium]
MKIGLAAYRVENKNTEFNISQIERAMIKAAGKADLLCFGEAVLQGFDSLCWNYDNDKEMAVSTGSETMNRLKDLTRQHGIGIAFGYIEKDGEILYSSYAVIDAGNIVHNYRRISRGWKEFTRTDDHYREGNNTTEFSFRGRTIMVGLCGDLWDYPERFKTDSFLIWPVYVNFSLEDWDREILEYTEQAAGIADDVLMINPIDNCPVNHGGAFHFHKGKLIDSIPFDAEDILIVEA